MTPTNTKPEKFFNIPNDKKALNEKEFIANYKNEILELILTQKASIKSTSKIIGSVATEHSVVRSLPTLVSVDFKEDFGIIGIYE